MYVHACGDMVDVLNCSMTNEKKLKAFDEFNNKTAYGILKCIDYLQNIFLGAKHSYQYKLCDDVWLLLLSTD